MAKRLHKRGKKQVAIRIGEDATPERQKQLGGVVTEVVDRDSTGKVYIKRHRGKLECVLDFYLRTRRMQDSQHAAGIRLRGIYACVSHGFDGSNLSNMCLVDNGHGDHEKQMVLYLDNLNQLKSAYAILTSAQQRILRDVCGYDQYAKNKDDKETLLRGLDRLAKFWGYA